jgi:hypothetical protein
MRPLPKNRAEWWAAKLGRNKERDRLVTRTLRKAGWRVVRVWECDLVKAKNWTRVAPGGEGARHRQAGDGGPLIGAAPGDSLGSVGNE